MAQGVIRVLMVAHYFPPDGGAGTQRPASFCRSLPDFGIKLAVVTRAVDDAARGRWEPRDDSIDAGGRGVAVHRATLAGNESWTDALERLTREVARSFAPDIVLVTLGPFEHARIAFSVPTAASVVDLRDPWALDGWMVHRHRLALRAELGRMRRALTEADGVVANVPGARDAFRTLAPRIGALPYAVVTNGWEESDFATPVDVPRGDRWRVRMSGTFLSADFAPVAAWKRPFRMLRASGERIDRRGRSPHFLLEALAALSAEGHPAGRDALLEVAGHADHATEQLVAASPVADRVRLLGYIPHAESVRFIREAHALVLPMHGLPSGGRARMVPGKLYEYLAAGRPILGLAPEGDARDWISEDPRSAIADPCSVEGIKAALVRLHAGWRDGTTGASERTARTASFTRRRQAELLADYLHTVVERRRSRNGG